MPRRNDAEAGRIVLICNENTRATHPRFIVETFSAIFPAHKRYKHC